MTPRLNPMQHLKPSSNMSKDSRLTDSNLEDPDKIFIIGERSQHTFALTEDEFYGIPYLTIRKGHFIKGGTRFWSRIWISLQIPEAQELQKILSDLMLERSLVNRPSNPQTVEESRHKIDNPKCRRSLQDQVLVLIVEGHRPSDICAQIFGDTPESRIRFTDIGKALRRCGYLTHRIWEPTDKGVERARSLRGEGGRSSHGEVILIQQGESPSEIPQMPTHPPLVLF